MEEAKKEERKPAVKIHDALTFFLCRLEQTMLESPSLFHCATKDACLAFFVERNDFSPQAYATLARGKLMPSNRFANAGVYLTEDQDMALRGVTSWDDYCSTLTLRQIKFVGW